jgi:hypothetical protein
MRILRLRLKDYRGIETLDVPLRRNGITVIAGPNEAGKSSLAEAVRFLFDHYDSTVRADVRATKPVHRDAGPEIEIEVETGPYAFTYRKRFFKRPLTELAVTRPHPENLTGREAHDRAEAILAETMDFDLWRALLVEQGRAFEQADLSRQSALTKALDRAAGGTSADPRGESLFDLAREEAARFYTEGGKERRPLEEARATVEALEKEAAECRAGLRQIENDIVESARAAAELHRLDLRIAELEERVRAHEKEEAEIAALENSVALARVGHESRVKSREAADRDVKDREALATAAARAREEHAKSSAACEEHGPELRAAGEALRAAEEMAKQTNARRREAEALAELRRLDYEHLRGRLDLAQLTERRDRVDRARNDAALARGTLARNPVDDACLARVEAAERDVAAAEARLSAGAPNVRLRALAPLRLEFPGETREVPAGAEQTVPVPDRVTVVVPGHAEVEVAAGASLFALQKKLAAAKGALDAACAEAKIDGPGRAREAHRERQEAERTLARLLEVEKADLRDLSYEDLAAKVAGLSKYVPSWPERRPTDGPPLPATLEEARLSDRLAREALDAGRSAAEAARTAFEEARARRDRLQAAAGEQEGARRTAEQVLRRAEEELAAARQKSPDADLSAALTLATEAEGRAAQDFAAAKTALRRKDPEKVRKLAEADAESLDAARRGKEETTLAHVEVQRRLASLGEAGLEERLSRAEAEGERARETRDDLLRRAAGAKLLLDTLALHRDAVRRTYLGPLRERIEALGRLLFDETFRVEVGDDLGIRSRTRNGVTVEFRDLSTGTKEQLALIARIACAMLVAEEGGPLLLDDVLGHTDPGRLAAMGAILRLGGKQCQLVLFTSIPDRYANVGDAAVVRLPGAAL